MFAPFLLERKTRFELATLALARRCSTPEPLPHILVEESGFEPLKAKLTDLQSAPFGHSGTPPHYLWSWQRDLNPRPADYKSAALPAELCQRILSDRTAQSVFLLAIRIGFEPTTSSVTGWHSNQLNYRTAFACPFMLSMYCRFSFGESCMNIRPFYQNALLIFAKKPAQNLYMVGATGLEPVTPCL